MEGHCSTGQSTQWAVVPMEEEEEEEEDDDDMNTTRSEPDIRVARNGRERGRKLLH